MNVVDSSGWLEYFADGPNADFFGRPVEATPDLLVPTFSIYENEQGSRYPLFHARCPVPGGRQAWALVRACGVEACGRIS